MNHEKFSKVCGGRVPAGRERVAKVTAGGETVTIVNVTGSEEVVNVELAVQPTSSLQCQYCHHEFSSSCNWRKHSCLLQPSLDPSHPRLRVLEDEAAAAFREDHR